MPCAQEAEADFAVFVEIRVDGAGAGGPGVEEGVGRAGGVGSVEMEIDDEGRVFIGCVVWADHEDAQEVHAGFPGAHEDAWG